jgi:hypothetical protein
MRVPEHVIAETRSSATVAVFKPADASSGEEELRAARAAIARLEFPPFRPFTALGNGHLQTLAPLLRKASPLAADAVHRIETSDGDTIILHENRAAAGTRPLGWSALLLHGLCGSHASSYLAQTARALMAIGVDVFRLDFRGCGAGAGLARRPYHAGLVDDPLHALALIRQRRPKQRVALIGWSLGANVALVTAAGNRPTPGVSGAGEPFDGGPDAVLAFHPPLNLADGCRRLTRGLNRLYDRYFVRSLSRHVERIRAVHPEAPGFRGGPSVPARLVDFDDRYTAPAWGFSGAAEYYAACSAGPRLSSIRVPALIISARNDPMVAPGALQEAVRAAGAPRLHRERHGGHLGYVGRPRDWMADRSADFLAAVAGRTSGERASPSAR